MTRIEWWWCELTDTAITICENNSKNGNDWQVIGKYKDELVNVRLQSASEHAGLGCVSFR